MQNFTSIFGKKLFVCLQNRGENPSLLISFCFVFLYLYSLQPLLELTRISFLKFYFKLCKIWRIFSKKQLFVCLQNSGQYPSLLISFCFVFLYLYSLQPLLELIWKSFCFNFYFKLCKILRLFSKIKLFVCLQNRENFVVVNFLFVCVFLFCFVSPKLSPLGSNPGLAATACPRNFQFSSRLIEITNSVLFCRSTDCWNC